VGGGIIVEVWRCGVVTGERCDGEEEYAEEVDRQGVSVPQALARRKE
jgi:hypothetical protein